MALDTSAPQRYFLTDPQHTYSGCLYKYMSNLEYIKTAIKDKTIFLSHPSSFNDPFDGGFMMTEKALRKFSCKPSLIYQFIAQNLNTTEKTKLEHLISHGDFLRKIEEIISVISEKERFNPILTLLYMLFRADEFLKTRVQSPTVKYDSRLKIFCFSQTGKSFPMWAHYANNHQGVCLEYDAKNVQLSKDCDVPIEALTVVRYSDNYVTDDIEDNMRCFYKSDQWAYEKEVRIVCQMEGNVLKFPYLCNVILGVNMPQKMKDELAGFCLDNGVDVWCAEVDNNGTYDLSICQHGDIYKKYMERKLSYPLWKN